MLLRRPAVIQHIPEPWTPPVHMQAAAERRWEAMCAVNDRLFDGTLLQVMSIRRNGHGGAVIFTRPCAFRWYAVQVDGPDCGCRPLGVKGIVTRGDEALMGRRSPWTTFHGDMWEFAASGGVEPGTTPEQALVQELREETGLTSGHTPRPRAVLYDDTCSSWEVLLEVALDSDQPLQGGPEYTDLRWCNRSSLPRPLTPLAARMDALLA